MTDGCLFVVVDGDNVSDVMIVFGSEFSLAFIAFFLSMKLPMLLLMAISPCKVCMSFEISIQVGSLTSSLLSLECSLSYSFDTSCV